ncbi:DUF262 domain-containing protein [Variovorax rhizosphaerae]|uniref:DUF262 domain-containing protein n=1 Tax=Variovorax rhizosphaerae TaxID=1836200 RepID=A0ABU8WRL9_9BURK
MSDTLTALASENLNPSLRSLLEDVQRGHIRVPRFQRPFVWTDSQRLELLRSVRDNMPIGSLLVWRTIKFKLASFATVGPQVIPPIAPNAPPTGWQYLLDGHQRVSTLLGLLLQPTLTEPVSSVPEDSIDWDIQYDLIDLDFTFLSKIQKKESHRPMLPLWTLLDGRLVNRHMRDLRRQGASEGWTEEQLDGWEERADQLSYRFQQCRIPIVVMVSDDLELAARTFQRINSLGTPMGEAHLVAALTWRSDFDLRERLDQLRQELPAGWREAEDGLFLQVCKGLAGLDMTKSGQTELVKRLTDDSSILERAGTALSRALAWLSGELGVVREELLPYAFQVVLLAVELARRPEIRLPAPPLASWFWRTGWSEVFATSAYRTVKEEQEILARSVGGGDQAAWAREQDLPARFDFRSARVRLFVLRLARRPELTNAQGQIASGTALLSKHGREAMVRLFPVPRGASPSLKQKLQGAGNRFLVDPNSDWFLRDRLKVGPDLSDMALASHFVDTESLLALRAGRLEEFIGRRAEAMNIWDRNEFELEQQDSRGPDSKEV